MKLLVTLRATASLEAFRVTGDSEVQSGRYGSAKCAGLHPHTHTRARAHTHTIQHTAYSLRSGVPEDSRAAVGTETSDAVLHCYTTKAYSTNTHTHTPTHSHTDPRTSPDLKDALRPEVPSKAAIFSVAPSHSHKCTSHCKRTFKPVV